LRAGRPLPFELGERFVIGRRHAVILPVPLQEGDPESSSLCQQPRLFLVDHYELLAWSNHRSQRDVARLPPQQDRAWREPPSTRSLVVVGGTAVIPQGAHEPSR